MRGYVGMFLMICKHIEICFVNNIEVIWLDVYYANAILKQCRFLKVIVVDDDFNDDDLLMKMNYYMKNDGDLMVTSCMKNDGVYVGDLLVERMHYWVICSCIHK